ncbi:hypothetical protein SVAN01_03390 [Stagonosporopsis vannaccii]|nr:hypothetical protein SVAN01_03390 [Stagonosporopsis vannaccii]
MANIVANPGDTRTTAMKQPLFEANATSSPPSGNSSDTLNDNEGLDEERKRFDYSPLTTTTLNFDDLQIRDSDRLYPLEHNHRLTGTFYGEAKLDCTPSSGYSHRFSQFSRNSNHHFGPGRTFLRGGGDHGNAHTWVSDESGAAQEFLTVRNSMRRMFKNADVARWKIADYIAHREAVMASKATLLAQTSESQEVKLDPRISPEKQDMMKRCGLFGNFEQVGNFSRALGERTIWCKDWQNGKDEVAPWPCLAEMKWEGDDRAKTGVGRYPPLPREQGPVGLPWNQLEVVEQYPLDQIARIPTMEDVYLPVDEIEEDVKYDLLNKDLEDAINAYLES